MQLDKFFPELFNMPKMILSKKCSEKKEQVTAIEYIECYNIFVLGIQTPKGSRLEVYAFLSPASMSSFAARQSMIQTTERMSVMQTEEIERQYISEYYSAEQSRFQETRSASKTEIIIDRQNSLLSPAIEA
jgi:hypothetical protein